MGSIGAGLSGFFGGQNNYTSNAQAASQNLFIDPNQAQDTAMLQKMRAQNGQTPTAQAAQMGYLAPSLTQDAQSRGQQNMLAGQLAQTAAGQGPSVASLQLQQGLQQQLAQQQAAAASMTGDANPFLAQRQAQQLGAQAMQQTNAAAAQARIQEQLNAQNNLGSLLGTMRGQDQSSAFNTAQMQQNAAQTNAQLAQQTALSNQQASLQQQQINNQNQQFAAQGLLNISSQAMQGNEDYAKSLNDMNQFNNLINSGVAQQNAQTAGGYGSKILGTIGAGLSSLF